MLRRRDPAAAESGFQRLQLRLIKARPGDVITVPEGVHAINRGLSPNVSGATPRGLGMERSNVSFKRPVQGAEGLLVNASDFTIEDLAIEDTAGDCSMFASKHLPPDRVLVKVT